jgi:aspartate/methionine/tyrosine aminotransferase
VELAGLLERLGVPVSPPAGGFYLWVPAPDGDAWALARRFAEQLGMLVSPGEFYGDAGRGHVRVAAVQPDDRLALLADRVDAAGR